MAQKNINNSQQKSIADSWQKSITYSGQKGRMTRLEFVSERRRWKHDQELWRQAVVAAHRISREAGRIPGCRGDPTDPERNQFVQRSEKLPGEKDRS